MNDTSAPDRMQRIIKSGVLRIGTSMDTPGFSMRDAATGALTGHDIDMLVSLAAALGDVRIEYVKIKFSSMLDDLLADKFDIASSGMGRNLARARVATFSRPYLSFGRQMIIRSCDKDKFRTLADLDRPNVRIGSNTGGPNQWFADKHLPNASRIAYPGNEIAHCELIAGHIDAQVTESTVALYMSKVNPAVTPMGPLHDLTYIAILARREDHTLVDFINIWLDQIELDGTLSALSEKWLGAHHAPSFASTLRPA